MLVRPLRTVALVVCSVGLVACSAKVTVTPEASIAKETLEQGIADILQQKVGQRPDSVTCPGPVKAATGQSVRCELTTGGAKYGLTATVNSYQNGKANYSVQVDDKPSG